MSLLISVACELDGLQNDRVLMLSTAISTFLMNTASRYTESKRQCRAQAFETEFGTCLGTESTLMNWQKLCNVVGIQTILPSITQCENLSFSVVFFSLGPNVDLT